MSFNERYELLVPMRDDGIKTFVAREVNSGRALEVHLFLSGRTAESAALLDRLNTLPAEARAMVLECGEQDSTPYVVTEMLPKRQSLRDWVRSFPVPASQIPTEEFPALKIAPASPVAGPGEFTRLFGTSAQPTPPSTPAAAALQKGETLPPFRMPPRDPVAKGETLPPFRTPARSLIDKGATLPPFRVPSSDFLAKGETLPPYRVPSQPSGDETNVPAAPGGSSNRDEDFLKLFQVPSRDKPGTSMSSAPAAPVAPPAPGEFTSLFAVPAPTIPGAPRSPSPLYPPAPQPENSTPVFSPPRAPQANPAGPSDFTRLFSTPVSVTPAPVNHPLVRAEQPSVPGAVKPGEFTRLFSAPAAPAVPATQPSRPGEFTQLFSSPPDTPTPAAPTTGQEAPPQADLRKAPAGPGEFTRMFSTPSGGAVPPAPEFRFPTTAPQGGNTPAGGLPPADPFAPSPAPSARPDSPAGEFTRMFGRPGSTPPPADFPPVSNATQVFAPPAATPAGTPVQPQGPSEYTRMFASPPRSGDVLGLNTPPASGGGSPPQMEMPQVPQFPQAPQVPQFSPRPQTSRIFQLPEERAQKSSVLPYVLLAVLFVLAVAVVILFTVRD